MRAVVRVGRRAFGELEKRFVHEVGRHQRVAAAFVGELATRDGAQVIEVLTRRQNVTVFYGHIHQEHHTMTGNIAHHAARSLMFPLPAPGSQEKRLPVPWDAAAPYRGLGWRQVEVDRASDAFALDEKPIRNLS